MSMNIILKLSVNLSIMFILICYTQFEADVLILTDFH